MKTRKQVLDECDLTDEERQQVEESLQRSAEDEAYERAALRAQLNDFEDTDGKDWT